MVRSHKLTRVIVDSVPNLVVENLRLTGVRRKKRTLKAL
jgi:hypothetical protein